jgi:hypothetical protein
MSPILICIILEEKFVQYPNKYKRNGRKRDGECLGKIQHLSSYSQYNITKNMKYCTYIAEIVHISL